jgi:hypothetical protein
MVTAADGAEAFYGSATNAIRLESAQDARELDIKSRKAWEKHPKGVLLVENPRKGGFNAKLQRALEGVAELTSLVT